MSARGCQYGDKCKFIHNVDDEAMKGRCFFCSAEDHWVNACPIKAAAKSEARANRQGVPPEGKGAKSAGKGKPSAKAQVGPKVKSLEVTESSEVKVAAMPMDQEALPFKPQPYQPEP